MTMKKSKFKAPDADVMLSDGSEKSLRLTDLCFSGIAASL